MGKGCTKMTSILHRKPSSMHDQTTDTMRNSPAKYHMTFNWKETELLALPA